MISSVSAASPAQYKCSRNEDVLTVNDGLTDWHVKMEPERVHIDSNMGTLYRSWNVDMKADHYEVARRTVGCFGSGSVHTEAKPYPDESAQKDHARFGLVVAAQITGIPLAVLAAQVAPPAPR